jgi:hypothetical protein
VLEVALMPTNATRLSDRQLKAVKATGKDFVLSDGDGLQLRVRASGPVNLTKTNKAETWVSAHWPTPGGK